MNAKQKITEGFDPNRIQSQAKIAVIKNGLIALVVSIIFFFFSLDIFPYTTLLPEINQIGENAKQIKWDILEGLASLATLSLVVGGVVFTFIDYIKNAVQRKREEAQASFSIYTEVYDRLMNPVSLAARRWVIQNLPTLEDVGNDKKIWLDNIIIQVNKTPRGWKGDRSPGKEHIKEILNTFDYIGFVAKYYWNMENELVMWMSPSIGKVWERIEVFVEEEAVLRNEPDYYESAREFGKYCVEWRRNRYPKSNIINNAT